MTTATETPVQPKPAMGLGARLVGVLFSPGATFADIARRPKGWWLPLILLIGVSLAGTLLIAPKLDVDGAVQQTMAQLEKRNPNMTDEQRERTAGVIRGQMEFMTRRAGRWIAPFVVVIPFFFVPLLWHGMSAMWGKAGSYKAVLTAYGHIQIVQVVKGVLVLIVGSTKQTIDIQRVNHLLKSSLGAFLDPETASKPLLALASNIDVFELWAVVLGCIALPRVTRLTPKGAAAVVIGIWLLWVLIQTGGAALGAMFGG